MRDQKKAKSQFSNYPQSAHPIAMLLRNPEISRLAKLTISQTPDWP